MMRSAPRSGSGSGVGVSRTGRVGHGNVPVGSPRWPHHGDVTNGPIMFPDRCPLSLSETPGGPVNTRARPPLAIAACVVAAACGGGGGGGGGGTARTLSGTVEYDFVPATFDPPTGAGGLDFAQAARRPVRDATVQV